MYGICNVVGASIPRNTDSGTYIHVGPEIGVASTKAFTGQVTVLMLLALCVGQMRGTVDDATVERIVRELKNMPLYIKDVLGLADKIKNLSKIYTYARNFLYLGRGYNYPLDKDGQLYSFLEEAFSRKDLMLLDVILDESKRTSKGIAVEKMPFLKDKKLVIPTKDLFPCAPERFSNMIDNNFCVRLKKQELTEEEYIEQKEEYLKTGDAKIIIYALNVRHSDAIHLEEMQVMTEETRQQNDGKLFKKLPLLCEQIGIGTLTVSEYLHRNGFFIDK